MIINSDPLKQLTGTVNLQCIPAINDIINWESFAIRETSAEMVQNG